MDGLWRSLVNQYRYWFWSAPHWVRHGDAHWQNQDWDPALAAYEAAIARQPTYYPAWRCLGRLCKQQERYSEAVKHYDRALKLNASDPVVWCEQGEVWEALQRLDPAIASYREAWSRDAQHLPALVRGGALLMQCHRYQEAASCFARLIELQPEETHWPAAYQEAIRRQKIDQVLQKLYAMGDEAFAQKAWPRVAAIYAKAIALDGEPYLPYLRRGVALVYLKDYTNAQTCLHQATECQPQHRDAWYYQGRALENLHQFQEALACFNRVLKIHPDDAPAWDGRALALSFLDHPHHAFTGWQQAVMYQPNYSPAWVNQGMVHASLQEYAEAIAAYDRAIHYDPQAYHAWIQKGIVLATQKDWEGAISCWETAIAISPHPIDVLENRLLSVTDLGSILLKHGAFLYDALLESMKVYAEAQVTLVRRYLDQALKLNPRLAQAWWYQGRITKYELNIPHLERDRRRLNCYLKALQLIRGDDRDYPAIYTEHLFVKGRVACDLVERAQSQLESGHLREALQDLENSLKIYGELGDNSDDQIVKTYRLRGHLYAHLGKFDRAFSDLSHALDYDSPSRHLTYYERGHLYHLQHHLDQALIDYNESLALKDNFSAYQSRGLVYCEKQQYAEAIADWEQASRLNPSDPHSCYHRAFAKSRIHDTAGAIDDFLQAAELFRMGEDIPHYRLAIGAVEHLKAVPEDNLEEILAGDPQFWQP